MTVPLIELCDDCKRELELAAKDRNAAGYFLCEGCLRVFATSEVNRQILCDDCEKEMT